MKPLQIGVIGIDHRHIYGMLATGAQRTGWDSEGTPPTLEGFTVAVPHDRAAIAICCMERGRDVMLDKPGCISLADLALVKRRYVRPDASGRSIFPNALMCRL